jgi:hypothetical protein
MILTEYDMLMRRESRLIYLFKRYILRRAVREPFEVDAKPLGNIPGVNYDSFAELLEYAEGPWHK